MVEASIIVSSVSLVVSILSCVVAAAGLAFTVYRANQETISRASKYNCEYGEKARPKMSFFTRYKNSAREGSYTDAFIRHTDPQDVEAEDNRGYLAGFWDQVVEDHKKRLLPRDFFSADSGKWLQSAMNYRELVEPIDMANFKRLGFEDKSGGYLEHNNRPSRYVYIDQLEKAAAHLGLEAARKNNTPSGGDVPKAAAGQAAAGKRPNPKGQPREVCAANQV